MKIHDVWYLRLFCCAFFLYLVACHLVKYALSRLGIVQALDTQEMKLRQLLRGLLAKFKSR